MGSRNDSLREKGCSDRFKWLGMMLHLKASPTNNVTSNTSKMLPDKMQSERGEGVKEE